MRLMAIGCLVLLASACFAQQAPSPSVVLGQNAAGQDVYLRVIELKYLDPVAAVDLLSALGYPGVVIPVSPPRRPGQFEGAYQQQGGSDGYGRRQGSRTNRQSTDGYGGYQEAQGRAQQYPGYNSPYGAR